MSLIHHAAWHTVLFLGVVHLFGGGELQERREL